MIQTLKTSGNDVGVVVCEQRRDEGLRFFNDGCIGTLRTFDSGGDKRVIDGLRIRKLTPKECWRLMGFSDEDFEKASKVNSNTQLYKQAGNSIVVNVLMAIFKELL
jgi:DNA (cytosine-5)-methyltransferase 1